MQDYFISIFYSEEEEGYIADIPDLRFCSAFGKTPDEALAEVQIARQAWLEAARVAGKSLPEPQYHPAIYRRPHMNEETTNNPNASEEDLLPEYRFDYSKAKPNSFAHQLRERQIMVVLDPDVASVFGSAEEVNRVLRALIQTVPVPS